MSRLKKSVVLALAFGLVAGAVAPVGAQAAKACPKTVKGELVRSAGGVTWTKGGSLYVCTAAYGDPAVSKKIGPWTKQSKLAFTGSTVAWTVRKNENGFSRDLIYAADGPYGTWLKGVRATTGPGSSLDHRVSRLSVYGDAAAWVTTQGTLMMAVESPDGAEAETVGSGTPGAAAPVVPGVTDDPNLSAADLLSYPQGLRDPLGPTGKRLLIGRWTAYKGGEFANTLQIKDGGDGDGDECGGVSSYEVTVRPVAGQPRVGAEWLSSWTSNSLACTS